METQNDLLSATRIVPPAEKGGELTPGYRFLPFLAGIVAVLPTVFHYPGGTLPCGLFLGLMLFIQAWIDSAILDKDKQQRPYFKVFAEAQLIGCISICFMVLVGIEAWPWVSIVLTAVYTLIRLIAMEGNVWAIAVHFLTVPTLLLAFLLLLFFCSIIGQIF